MRSIWLTIALALLLSGCGNERTTSTTSPPSLPPPPGTGETVTVGEAQGVYSGSYVSGNSFYAVVLPNDMFYAFDGGGGIGADGIMADPWVLRAGQGKSASGKYTADLTHYVWGETLPSSLTATYVPGSSLAGSIEFLRTGLIQQFNLLALPRVQLDFTHPAQIADIAGTWKGAGLCDPFSEPCDPLMATIAPNGDLTMSGYAGCTFATLAPDESRNYFHVTVPVGAGACFAGSSPGTGFAVVMLLPNGTTRQLLFAMMVNSSGGVLIAQR